MTQWPLLPALGVESLVFSSELLHKGSPGCNNHDAVASGCQGNGEAAYHIPQAPCFAPGAHLRGDKDGVQGLICLSSGLIRL